VRLGGWGRVFGLLRIQVVAVLIFTAFLAGIGQNQIPDVLLRWGDLDGGGTATLLGMSPLLVGLLALAAFSVLLWRSGHRAMLTGDPALPPPWPVAVAVASLLCLVLGLGWPGWRRLAGLGVVLLSLTALTWLAGAPFWRLGREFQEPRRRRTAARAPGSASATAARREARQRAYDDAMAAAEARGALVDPETRARAMRFGRWLAAVPPAVVGFALVRTTLPPVIVLGSQDGPGRQRMLGLTLLGVVLVLVAAAVPPALGRADRRIAARVPLARGFRGHRVYWCLGGGAAAVYATSVLVLQQALPTLLGPLAVLLVFLAVALVLVNEAQRLAERTVPVAGLRLLGAQRNPVLVLLVAWFTIGSLLDTTGHHPVRKLTAADAVTRQAGAVAGPGSPATGPAQGAYPDRDPTEIARLEDAFTAWARANCAVGSGASTTEPVPMVFVAASGGGIRAAYWTAGVLDQLFPADGALDFCGAGPRDRVFAVSGASGGSVGAAFWLEAERRDAAASPRPWYRRTAVANEVPHWYDAELAVDHLSPTAAWMLYVDIPRGFLGFPGPDRAALLEQSWESSQPALLQGFLGSYRPTISPDSAPAASDATPGASDPTPAASTGSWRPLALLNATAAESGCRALTAPVSLTGLDDPGGVPSILGCRKVPGPGSQVTPVDATGLYDLTELFLCRDDDLRLSTAMLLSARFPYVSPAGRITTCAAPHLPSYVVDGGYLDNSGSLSATDAYLAVKPLVEAHNARLAACEGECPGDDPLRPRRAIRPVFLQIDNGYPSSARIETGGRPQELLIPPKARLAVAGGVEKAARQRSFTVFGPTAYLRVSNAPHPGVQAPLGWALSDTARDELCQELAEVNGSDPDRPRPGQSLADVAKLMGVPPPEPATC